MRNLARAHRVELPLVRRLARWLVAGFLSAVATLSSFAALTPVPYVVHVSIDGLGAVYLQPYVTNAPDQFPNFARLKAQGASTFNARCDFGASETIPNHTSMFTGRPAFQPTGMPNTTQHGYTNNSPPTTDTYHNAGNLNVPYKASVFDVAHDYGLSTALYAGKAKFSLCDRSFDAMNGAVDLTGLDNGRDKIDFAFIGDFSTYYNNGTVFTEQIDELIDNLQSGGSRRYSFLHISEPDLTGHKTGWGDAAGNYSNMVRQVDAQLGRIFAALESNPVLSNHTALIVTTDHGGGGESATAHSVPTYRVNYTIPFFVWGPGIPAGVDLYALMHNRGSPGTNRTDYTTVPQPIRNGDSGNLALSLLSLPSIPGSLMLPFFDPAGLSLTAGKSGSAVTLSWPAAATEYVLESTLSLGPSAAWQPITNGIIVTNAMKVWPVNTAVDAGRYYRLRKF